MILHLGIVFFGGKTVTCQGDEFLCCGSNSCNPPFSLGQWSVVAPVGDVLTDDEAAFPIYAVYKTAQEPSVVISVKDSSGNTTPCGSGNVQNNATHTVSC